MNKTHWDSLSVKEKSDIFKFFINKGIYNKKEIKSLYNKYKNQETEPITTMRGQWDYPGQVTKIPSNNITMKGVNYPVLGVSDTGDTKLMQPNGEYHYNGNSVTEYPIYQDGGSIKTKDPYQYFLGTLPKNLAIEDPNYNMRRYWELHGYPKDFNDAMNREEPMFTKQKDGYHANSIAYDKVSDTYEFMKSANHPTHWMELDQYYNSNDPEMIKFRQEYKYVPGIPGNKFVPDRYIRRKAEGGLLDETNHTPDKNKMIESGKGNVENAKSKGLEKSIALNAFNKAIIEGASEEEAYIAAYLEMWKNGWTSYNWSDDMKNQQKEFSKNKRFTVDDTYRGSSEDRINRYMNDKGARRVTQTMSAIGTLLGPACLPFTIPETILDVKDFTQQPSIYNGIEIGLDTPGKMWATWNNYIPVIGKYLKFDDWIPMAGGANDAVGAVTGKSAVDHVGTIIEENKKSEGGHLFQEGGVEDESKEIDWTKPQRKYPNIEVDNTKVILPPKSLMIQKVEQWDNNFINEDRQPSFDTIYLQNPNITSIMPDLTVYDKKNYWKNSQDSLNKEWNKIGKPYDEDRIFAMM